MKKRILIISPVEKLITNFAVNSLKYIPIPTILSFSQMALTSGNSEEFEIKNIHNILLSLNNLNSFTGLIILLPIKGYKKINNEDLVRLNTRLINAGVKAGVSILILDENGVLQEGTLKQNFIYYLDDVASN